MRINNERIRLGEWGFRDRLRIEKDPVKSQYKLRQQIDVSTQRSETDLAVVCGLIHRGFSIEAIAEGVKTHSFNIEKRHPKLDDYLRRTVARGLLNVIEEKSPQLAS
ncbi:MAG: hypothetical protein WBM44_17150 [Waterburya sp.]